MPVKVHFKEFASPVPIIFPNCPTLFHVKRNFFGAALSFKLRRHVILNFAFLWSLCCTWFSRLLPGNACLSSETACSLVIRNGLIYKKKLIYKTGSWWSWSDEINQRENISSRPPHKLCKGMTYKGLYNFCCGLQYLYGRVEHTRYGEENLRRKHCQQHSMLPQPAPTLNFPSFLRKIFADFLLLGSSVISQFWECIVKESPFYRQSLKYSVYKIRTFAAVLWRPRMYEHLGRNQGINSWQICQPVTINVCTLFCVVSRVPYFVE